MNWQILFGISFAWAVITGYAIMHGDWKNVMVYGGILLTNTGLALHAIH